MWGGGVRGGDVKLSVAAGCGRPRFLEDQDAEAQVVQLWRWCVVWRRCCAALQRARCR
jgi:hypothetical protein